MAYSSKIDLGGLGEVPKTTDPSTFPDLIDVYNAIHILAQWVDAYSGQGEDGPDRPNWENFPITDFWWGKAAVDIKEGQFVGNTDWYSGNRGRPNYRAYKGVVLGAAGILYRESWKVATGSEGGDNDATIYTRFYNHKFMPKGVSGFAMNDARVGEDVRIAVGTGIVQLPGCKAGDKIIAKSSFSPARSGFSLTPGGRPIFTYNNDGSIYRIAAADPIPFVEGVFQIGVGTGDDEFQYYGSGSLPLIVNAWGDT